MPYGSSSTVTEARLKIKSTINGASATPVNWALNPDFIEDPDQASVYAEIGTLIVDSILGNDSSISVGDLQMVATHSYSIVGGE